MSKQQWDDGVRYGRRSTDKQDASLDEQRSWAVTAAQTERIRIVAEFEDDAIAGDEVARRQGLQELFAFVEAEQRAGRPIKCLLVWDLDRLSRADSVKTAVILDRLREAGVERILSQEGWVDLNDEIDMTMHHLKQDFSRRGYSKKISANVTRSCVERAKRGEWCGGPPPYGYVIGPDKHLALNESDAGVRHEAAQWMLATYRDRDTSLGEIARQLELRGVPPPRDGGRWLPGSVHQILTNPLYTGTLHYGRKRFGKYHRASAAGVEPCRPHRTRTGRVGHVKNAEEAQVKTPGAHPALIDEAGFAKVQAKLRGNMPAFAPGTTRRTFKWLFAGLARCAHCGQVMHGHVKTKPFGADAGTTVKEYVCSTYQQHGKGNCTYNHITEDRLLALVAGAIRDHFSRPELLEQVREHIRLQARAADMEGADLLPKWQKQATELKALIAQGTGRLAKVPDDLLEGLVAELRRYKQQLAEAQAEIAALKVRKQTGRQTGELLEAALLRLQELPSMVKDADHGLLREMFRSIIAKGGLELHFEVAPPAASNNGRHKPRRSYRLSHGTIETTSLAQLYGVGPTMFCNVESGKPLSTSVENYTIRFTAA